MGAFDEIIESGAERVFRQFEIEGNHRRRLEDRATRWQSVDLIIGKTFALIFVLSALGVSAFAIWLGSPVAGTILGSTVLASVVGAFVYQANK